MTIQIGDTINLSGSSQLMNGATLFAQQWAAPNGPNGVINQATRWQPGYEAGLWSTNADGTGQFNVSAINMGSEIEVYLSLTGQNNLGIPFPVSVDDPVKGPLRITPRLMTTAERAKINTRPELSSQTWLSFACIATDSLAPPLWFEFTAQFSTGAGCWPSVWAIIRGQWPPEIDTFELFNTTLTTSVHSTSGAWQATLPASTTYVNRNGPDFTATQDINPTFDVSAAFHRYGSLVYPDGIATFVDGVCVQTWPVPSDLAHAAIYPIINFAVGAPGSGAGTPPTGATSVGSMVISAVDIRSMPTVYGSGVAPPPPPPPSGVTAAQVTALKTAMATEQTALARVSQDAAAVQTGLTKMTTDTKAAQIAATAVQNLLNALKP